MDMTCATTLNCEACGSLNGCGWCETTSGLKVCLPGNKEGPYNVTSCGQWYYDELECLDQDYCLHNTNCASCASTFGCGWCGTICTLGNADGPTDPTAVCPVWKYRESACQDMFCDQFDTCGACTIQRNEYSGASQGCGWCSKGQCTIGIPDGPFDPKDCGQWMWPNSKCDEPKCDVHKDCGTCINDPSLNCGWCESTQRCIQGYNNISSEQCGDYQYGICRDSCFSKGTNCTNCVQDKRCGWCNGVCARGNELTPISLPRQACSPWKYGTCDARQCAELTDCNNCIESGCHWCPNSTVRCSETFSLRCCEGCANCAGPPGPDFVDSLYIIILSSTGTICGFLLLFSIVYVIKVYYWNKRHYYRKLS